MIIIKKFRASVPILFDALRFFEMKKACVGFITSTGLGDVSLKKFIHQMLLNHHL